MRKSAKPKLPIHINAQSSVLGKRQRWEVRFAWWPKRVLNSRAKPVHVWVWFERYGVFQTLEPVVVHYLLVDVERHESRWVDRYPAVLEEVPNYDEVLKALS